MGRQINPTMDARSVENWFIVILIAIIGCFLFPIIFNIINKALIASAEASVYGNIQSVELYYFMESTMGYAYLPFEIKYDEDSYKTYIEGTEYYALNKIESNGRQPESGEIVINENGEISVNKLRFSHIVCNKSYKGKVKCKRG